MKLRNSASCWLPLYECIMMHGPLNVKHQLSSCLLVHVHDASYLSNILPVTMNKTSYLDLGCLRSSVTLHGAGW